MTPLHTKAPYVLIAVLIATVVGLVFWRRDRRRLEELAKRSDEVCQRLEWDLEAIIANRTPIARKDLSVRIPMHHLDQGLMQLCLGRPIVIDSETENRCWFMTEHADECYVEIARELLAVYQAHRSR